MQKKENQYDLLNNTFLNNQLTYHIDEIPYSYDSKNESFKITNIFLLIHKRMNQESETLVEAASKGDYTYWLSQEDIAEISRLEYNYYQGTSGSYTEFEILGSLSQLHVVLETLQLKIQAHKLEVARLTTIINLDNFHWVTLVISYKHNRYVAYFADSKNKPLPAEYFQMLADRRVQVFNLELEFYQQHDAYNCGIWAIENAVDINKMIDLNESLNWVLNELARPRNKEYFNGRRQLFAEKLYNDPHWCERHPLFLSYLHTKKTQKLAVSRPTLESKSAKRIKITPSKKEKITNLLDTFVEAFIGNFITKLGSYHLLAKGERLTQNALISELKTGITGALLGASISSIVLSPVGVIPSLVASLRVVVSNNYYLSKTKAQKITKIFYESKSDSLRRVLSETAVNIFFSFENQFMQVTDKAGNKVAIEKLAEDAVGRLFSGIEKEIDVITPTKELLEACILKGPSEKFFDPSVKRARLRVSGYRIQDKDGNQINTANLYDKTGLVQLDAHKQPDKFYISKKFPNSEYGFRRLLDWEKETDGELKENLKDQYIEKKIFQTTDMMRFSPRKYHYNLDIASNKIEAKRILDKIENQYSLYSSQLGNKKYENKKPIYFNLIKPVENFSGREQILEVLHSILISKMTLAIVPSWSTLSISPSISSSSSEASSGTQLSISGLGGVGKTQLALRYAELYAKYYDHNILWFNAETKENIAYSFYKLAKKLQIPTQDRYNQNRNLEEIIEEVYEYFSDRKSLFIFDNAENYRNLETYLPKATPGNKPTLLITSQYTNWGNIATVLSLPVFTEQEAEELIKKSLISTDIPYKKTQELNQLLQGLPLALQQALAYIKLKRNLDPTFSIDHYIDLFKIKTKELLNFNFFDFSNDPYLKTVFTTWQITLDKIKNYPVGNEAIKILNIMAYLYPDHISGEKLFYLKEINKNFNGDNLNDIMHLLSTYSIINQKNNQNTYSIHRLVQQAIRFNVENNPTIFKETVKTTQLLIWHWEYLFKKDEEYFFHYLHFLLYMSEHKDLITSLVYGNPEKNFFDNLILQDIKYCQHFIDLAYIKFPKDKFLKFLGDAIAYYIKLGLSIYLEKILDYIEEKNKKNIFSKENIKYITNYFLKLDDPIFKVKRFSTNPLKQENQRKSMIRYHAFMLKIFGKRLAQHDSCAAHSLKRSICLLPEAKQIKNKVASKNQVLESHFKKIGQVSHFINSALMTKDILSALFQGHFDEVAMNFGLIASSIVFGKLSDILFTEGKSLVNNAYLLENNLGLENKKAFKILFNEEISIARKSQFLGKTMQVVSPFIAKGTSIFFIYNLKNEIQAYETGNKFVLPSLVSNGIIVSVEGLEASIKAAEFLEIIAGVSAFTGPIGEWVTLLTWLGTEAYSANQQLTAIEKYVHLSTGEKFFEFVLALLHQAPLEYLQLKATNGERVMHAIDFLKNNTAIRWYVFSAADFKADSCRIRKVFLTRKHNFTLNESNPDELGSDLFCLSAAPLSYNSPNENIKMKYLCHKALGVSYAINRTGNMTLIDLGDGEDEVISFSHSPTLFFIQNGKKSYIGSNNGNLFNLQGNSITGRLQGGNEHDRLILDKFYPENSDYVLLDVDSFLCGKNNYSMQLVHTSLFCSPDTMRVQIYEIEEIHGRKNQSDIFYINDSIQIIDGYGGKNKEHPDGFLITQYSHRKLQITLRDNTLIVISLNSKTHVIDYQIPWNEGGEALIQYDFKASIQHRFFFKASLYDIKTIKIKNNMSCISIRNRNDMNNKFFSISISDFPVRLNDTQTKNKMQYLKNLFYFFNEVELKLITSEYLNGKEIITDNKHIDEKISLLRELANRLKKSISIQLLSNITLSIGHEKKHEIFYINGLFETHLVGNGGENLYIILPEKATIFPLPKIILYNTLENDPNELIELIDTLDLRELVKKYKQRYSNAIISSHVFPKENDLIFTLSNSIYSPPNSNAYDSSCFFPWVTVQLKNALLNNSNWYQKLDIFLDSTVRNIAPIDDYFWTLTAAPLLFTPEKNIIVINNQDIEEHTDIIVLKNLGDCTFFRNETDLLLTNTLGPSLDYCTIIFHQFYLNSEMKKKVLSATIKFYDQEIILGFYQNKIHHADHFSHFTQVISSNTSKAIRDSYLNSLYIISPTEEKKIQSQPIWRHKRQADRNKANAGFFLNSTPSRQTIYSSSNHYSRSNLIDEKERILAIADDYLQKYDSINSKNKSYVSNKNKIRQKNEKSDSHKLMRNKHKSNRKNSSYSYKNNENFFKDTVLNNPNYNKPKLLNSLQKEKHFTELSFVHKKIKSNKTILNDQYHANKKDFFMKNQFLPFQEKNFKLNSNKIVITPKLIYEKNQSNSKKPNLQTKPSYIKPLHFNDTLMFLNFMVRKSLKNPIVPVSYDQKLNKTIKKYEKIKDKIKDKIFKVRN